MKKIFAILLLLGMLLSFAACGRGKGGAPDGYRLASNSKVCEYNLYVPAEKPNDNMKWTSESNSSDFTTAALTVTVEEGEGENKKKVDKLACTVSMAVVGTLGEGESVEIFWENRYKDSYGFLADCTASEATGVKLEGNVGQMKTSGMRYDFQGVYNGTTYCYRQVFFARAVATLDGGTEYPVYCVTYTAPEAFYADYLEVFEGILGNISFR